MSSFLERQKSLFDQLKDAEEHYNFSKSNKATPQDYGAIDRHTYRKLKHEMKQFRGRESIFKRSEANLRECLRAKRIPEYIKNPKNWVYYSLSDVTQEQMSESTNTATALALIREMEDKAEAKLKMEHDSIEADIFKKPTFHISSSIKKTPIVPDEKVIFKSSKVIMPEYVVGVSQKKDKKPVRKELSADSKDFLKKIELKLNHLYEDDE